jgi:Ca2+-binding RTX toxin-like protein
VNELINKGKTDMTTYQGTSGNNNYTGGGSADILYGYGGDDTLNGGNGNDKLYGGDGNDKLYGGKGHDWLYGGAGSDFLDGGEGNDFLRGGGATLGVGELDTLTGGKGADTFSLVDDFGNPGYANDDINGFALIKDFNMAHGDKIQLDGFASHYQLTSVFWGQSFGSSSLQDTAIMYIGPEQDKFDVVGVLQDVSLSSSYLEIPTVFNFV